MGVFPFIFGGSSESEYSETENTHSVSFDGIADTISFGDVLNKSNTDAWTLSIWLEPANTTQSSVFPAAKLDSGSDFAGWEIVQNTTSMEWWLLKTFTGSKYIKKTVTSVFAANTRVHLAIVMDGSSTAAGVTIYKNSVAQSATDNVDGLDGSTTTTAPMRIGARFATAAGFWAGKADWFCIIGKALDQTEVEELYNGGTTVDPRTLSFGSDVQLSASLGEDGDDLESASGVQDLSVNGYNGTASSMTNAGNKSTDIT